MEAQKDTITKEAEEKRLMESRPEGYRSECSYGERVKSTEAFCKAVGKRIKAERRAQKLTLKQLSELADISVSFLGDIEKGRSNPSLPRLLEISQALGKSPSYFLGEKNNCEGMFSEGEGGLLEEESAAFGNMEEGHRQLLSRLIKQPEFLTILELLDNFENWSGREKAELISLLKTKKEYCEN